MSYPGSKAQAGVWQRIIGQMPPHPIYVEPFFGSGQVFWRKRRAARSVIMDIDAGVIAKASAALSDGNTASWEVYMTPGCALDYLKYPALTLPAEAVIYCDPPYLLPTRQGRIYYDHELRDDQHAQLLTLLQALKCRVLLSGYPSELYGTTLQSWRCIRYRTRTRGKTVTECLWCNFPEPNELHDWRYAGNNFRQRLALSRLAKRWIKKLNAMPARQRGYVLDAIAQYRPPTPELAIDRNYVNPFGLPGAPPCV